MHLVIKPAITTDFGILNRFVILIRLLFDLWINRPRKWGEWSG